MGKTKLPHKSLTPESVSFLIKNRIQAYVNPLDGLYQDYATMVDSPAYIYQIIDARKLLNIHKTPFMDVDELVMITKHPLSWKSPGIGIPDYPMRDFLIELQDYEFWHKILDVWCNGDSNKKQELYSAALKINKSFNKPYYLLDATMQSILLGMAAGIQNEHVTEIGKDTILPSPSFVIFINPRTTYDHVKTSIKFAQKHISRYLLKEEHITLDKYVPLIHVYQIWYWEKLNGKTYSNIASEWAKRAEKLVEIDLQDCLESELTKDDKYGLHTTEIDVIKGVKKYMSLLHF